MEQSNNDCSLFLIPRDDPDRCTFGVLTQRLVSCLMEEKGSTFDFTEEDYKGENGTNGGNGILKKFTYGNAAQIEQRIKKELEVPDIIFTFQQEINDI